TLIFIFEEEHSSERMLTNVKASRYIIFVLIYTCCRTECITVEAVFPKERSVLRGVIACNDQIRDYITENRIGWFEYFLVNSCTRTIIVNGNNYLIFTFSIIPDETVHACLGEAGNLRIGSIYVLDRNKRRIARCCCPVS